jgi:hypothetical protein
MPEQQDHTEQKPFPIQQELAPQQRFRVEVMTVFTDDGEVPVTDENRDMPPASYKLLPVSMYGRQPRDNDVLMTAGDFQVGDFHVIDRGHHDGLHVGLPIETARRLLACVEARATHAPHLADDIALFSEVVDKANAEARQEGQE